MTAPWPDTSTDPVTALRGDERLWAYGTAPRRKGFRQ